ncbi:MAG: hypothetical protein R2789_11475 [Microthrixaceae bacterium]
MSCDRGLAGLAVTDDQLALATTDGDQRVDRLDAGLHRLAHGLTTHDAGSLDLHAPRLGVGERTLAVDGLSEGVDDTPGNTVANGHRRDIAGGADALALLDGLDLA